MLRLATWTTELSRRGPGVLLRDMLRGQDPQIKASLAVLAHANADVVALYGLDWDADLRALGWLAQQAGYSHFFALPPNRGLMTDRDLDGDGRFGRAGDAQGWGLFHGDGAMALISRHPILTEKAQDFSATLWQDLPWATLPQTDGHLFPSAAALDVQRLSSAGHWAVPIQPPDGPPVTLLLFHATPPVFDGQEDRNGLRNHDEILFAAKILDDLRDIAHGPLVILANTNLDPNGGEGRHVAMRALLAHERLQDPQPKGARQTKTVDWSDLTPGDLRVSYVLPDASLKDLASEVLWPQPDDPLLETAETASRHRMVWVDVDWPPAP